MTAQRALTVLRLDDERELAFAEFGAAHGTPVFAFHGTPGSHRLFTLLDDDAKRLGIRVIAPDRPGYGHSEFYAARQLLDWPRDVSAIADYLCLDRFGIFGVSGGGPHAAVCAHAFGERLLGAAIVCGIAEVLTHDDTLGMMPINRLFSRLARWSPQAPRPLFAAVVAALRRFPERMADGMSRGLPEPDRRILARADVRRAFVDEGRRSSRTTARAAAQEFALFSRPWGFALEEIGIPVDVYCGGLDVNVPVAHGLRQAARIPRSRLHQFPEEAHLLVFEHVEEILRSSANLA
jgi:pimeloyl-ACP methyl ester carboxylesterase